MNKLLLLILVAVISLWTFRCFQPEAKAAEPTITLNNGKIYFGDVHKLVDGDNICYIANKDATSGGIAIYCLKK